MVQHERAAARPLVRIGRHAGLGAVDPDRGRLSVRHGEVRCREIHSDDPPDLDRAVKGLVGDPDPAPAFHADDGEVGERDRLGQEAQVDNVLVQFELVDDIVAGILEVDEVVLSPAADQEVVARSADGDVVSVTAFEEVSAFAAEETIPLRVAGDVVVAGVPEEKYVLSASRDDVIAAPATHDVAVVSTADNVVAGPAEDVIAAGASLEKVTSAPAFDGIGVCAAVEGIIVRSADKDV